MSDPTEEMRRARPAEIEAVPGSREAMEAVHDKVWDTRQLAQDFVVFGFLAPLVVVRRKADGQKGSLEFQNRPRFYFDFLPDGKAGPAGE